METANGLLAPMWRALLSKWAEAGKAVVFLDLERQEDVKPEDVQVVGLGTAKVYDMGLRLFIGEQTFQIRVEEVTEGGPRGLVDPLSAAHEIFGRNCKGEGCPYCRRGALPDLTWGE